MPQYRARFIQQNPGNQTANVTNLFAQYADVTTLQQYRKITEPEWQQPGYRRKLNLCILWLLIKSSNTVFFLLLSF